MSEQVLDFQTSVFDKEYITLGIVGRRSCGVVGTCSTGCPPRSRG